MAALTVIILYVSVLICMSPVLAQEVNYNTYQYGTRSALMGGAAVGGVRDSSAVYYNPGSLGFIQESSLSVSANAYRFGTITERTHSGPVRVTVQLF